VPILSSVFFLQILGNTNYIAVSSMSCLTKAFEFIYIIAALMLKTSEHEQNNILSNIFILSSICANKGPDNMYKPL
jgi:hypothetical protein